MHIFLLTNARGAEQLLKGHVPLEIKRQARAALYFRLADIGKRKRGQK